MFGQPQVPSVDAKAAASKIAAGALLIDVHEQTEWDEARIPGALLRPMGTINEWFADLPTDREIVFQCRTGSRSAQVVKALSSQAGMENVWNLTGGIVAWVKAGNRVDYDPPSEEQAGG